LPGFGTQKKTKNLLVKQKENVRCIIPHILFFFLPNIFSLHFSAKNTEPDTTSISTPAETMDPVYEESTEDEDEDEVNIE
jgi:hypothetical protein